MGEDQRESGSGHGDRATDTLTDASLKLNGVSDGMISYNRVVELLLQWYGQQREY